MERHPRLTQTGDASLLMRIVTPRAADLGSARFAGWPKAKQPDRHRKINFSLRQVVCRLLTLGVLGTTVAHAAVTFRREWPIQTVEQLTSYQYPAGQGLPTLDRSVNSEWQAYFTLDLRGTLSYSAVNNTDATQAYMTPSGFVGDRRVGVWVDLLSQETSPRQVPCYGVACQGLFDLLPRDFRLLPGQSYTRTRQVRYRKTLAVNHQAQIESEGPSFFTPWLLASPHYSQVYHNGQPYSPDWTIALADLQGTWSVTYREPGLVMVPEPGTMALLAVALTGVVWRTRRSRLRTS